MRIILATLVLCTIFCVSLTPNSNLEAEQAKGESVQIECHFYYRPKPDKKFQSKTITCEVPLARGPVPEIARTQTQTIKFDDMTVRVLYDTNMLKTQVVDAKSDKPIYERLYQAAPGLKNQFNGGHGFTGLGYIYHPTSNAQLQTFCKVIEPK